MVRIASRRRTATPDRTPATPLASRFEIHPDTVDGNRVIRKKATGQNRRTLRREASVLTQINSSYVVRIVELVESEATTELITVDAGSRTLAEPAKMAPIELLRALRNCVDAVAELHSEGWEHGSIRAEHVVVGARGRIKMCSVASARRLSVSSNESSADDSIRRRRTDVTDLIELMAQVGRADVVDRTWRERRERAKLNRLILATSLSARDALRTTGSPTETLRYLCELLKTPPFATSSPVEVKSRDALVDTPPTITLRRNATGRRHSRSMVLYQRELTHRSARSQGRPTPSRVSSRNEARRQHVLSASVIVVATAIGIFVLGSATRTGTAEGFRSDTAPAGDRDDMDGGGPPTTDAADPFRRSDPTSTRPHPTGTGIRADGSTSGSSDLYPSRMDPSRTESALESTSDNLIILDGVSYSVGQPGDVAMSADWSCEGVENVLLLRPTTGEVFIFDERAESGSPSTGRMIGVHPGATDLIPTIERCGTASLEMADSSTVDVPLTAASPPVVDPGDGRT